MIPGLLVVLGEHCLSLSVFYFCDWLENPLRRVLSLPVWRARLSCGLDGVPCDATPSLNGLAYFLAFTVE